MSVTTDRDYQLRCLRGDLVTDDAYSTVQAARYMLDEGRLDDIARAALDEGDQAHANDPRRFEPLAESWKGDVDVDPETMEAFAAAGELVLDDVAMFLGRFVAFPSAATQTAVTLWAAHTHMVSAFESSPRLALLSPEPGSGKTRVLEVLELIVPRPQHVLNASPAALFRLIGDSRPTLLVDECDAIFGRRGKTDDGAEDLRGLLNAGHRRTATIPRCVGPSHKVEHFPVYAAVALAGLGDLPDTLMHRSVVVRMRRRAPGETVEPLRRRVVEPQGRELRDRLAEWAKLVADDCGEAWPEMPPGVTDRPADVWEPLLAIADAAGGNWPKMARDACVSLVGAAGASDEQSLGIRLLGDLRDVFGTDEKLATATVIERLVALDEAPWASLYGKPIDAAWLAKKLKPYGASPSVVRFGEKTARGYTAESLHDAWSRYLAPTPGGRNMRNTRNAPGRDVTPVTHVTGIPVEATPDLFATQSDDDHAAS